MHRDNCCCNATARRVALHMHAFSVYWWAQPQVQRPQHREENAEPQPGTISHEAIHEFLGNTAQPSRTGATLAQLGDCQLLLERVLELLRLLLPPCAAPLKSQPEEWSSSRPDASCASRSPLCCCCCSLVRHPCCSVSRPTTTSLHIGMPVLRQLAGIVRTINEPRNKAEGGTPGQTERQRRATSPHVTSLPCETPWLFFRTHPPDTNMIPLMVNQEQPPFSATSFIDTYTTQPTKVCAPCAQHRRVPTSPWVHIIAPVPAYRACEGRQRRNSSRRSFTEACFVVTHRYTLWSTTTAVDWHRRIRTFHDARAFSLDRALNLACCDGPDDQWIVLVLHIAKRCAFMRHRAACL